ncbi:UNVERIFIED_ORG: uncharacterized protein (DUF1778 family) [Rhizobium esperanzae]|nr:uncharacterized protein (DUF1778 family) [Rhizobium esperanzae]
MRAEMATTSDMRETKDFLMLQGAKVTSSFRSALFDAANRAGMTPNEFVLQAAAEKLAASGRHFSGLFTPGDLQEQF